MYKCEGTHACLYTSLSVYVSLDVFIHIYIYISICTRVCLPLSLSLCGSLPLSASAFLASLHCLARNRLQHLQSLLHQAQYSSTIARLPSSSACCRSRQVSDQQIFAGRQPAKPLGDVGPCADVDEPNR